MRRTIQFHKAFLPATLASVALLVIGLGGVAFKGLNLGVDFQAGVNQYVRLAYPAADVSYLGTGSAVLAISESTMTVVYSGAGVEARTASWDLKTVGTIAVLTGAMSSEGVILKARDGVADLPASLLIPTYQGTYSLGAVPVLAHRAPKSDAEVFGSIELVRKTLSGLGDISVQNVGETSSMEYMVRISDNGKDKSFSETMPAKTKASLESAFGAGKVVMMRTDYVGAQFSRTLASSSWKMTLFTVLAILAYATIRFKMQFALGAVLAIAHDGLMMLGFIVWTRMEFNTTSIAAILTILGFSINDTVVIFDRIRENRKLSPTESLASVLDRSITETLGRTFITALTTLLAIFSLYFFTSGSIKDFALALIVGMVAGSYSTIFIATGFVYLWDILNARRHPKPTAVKQHVTMVAD